MTRFSQARNPHTGEPAHARIILLALVFFLMGLAVSAWWFSRKPSANAAMAETVATDTFAGGVNASLQPSLAPSTDLAALDTVKRLLPDLHSVTLEEGTRILRSAVLAEFQQTAREFQARQIRAEEKFIQAENHSQEERQIATTQLQVLRADQAEKLKQIAAKLQAQIATLEQLKEVAR